MEAPIVLRLGFSLVDEGFHFLRHVSEQLDVSSRQARELAGAFSMSTPEKDFARALLRSKRNLWLYRCHQQCFCGDFAIVDMSGATPEERTVVVAELKERQTLAVNISADNQLERYGEVVAQLIDDGVITSASEVVLARGDSEELIAWLDS